MGAWCNEVDEPDRGIVFKSGDECAAVLSPLTVVLRYFHGILAEMAGYGANGKK